MTIFSDLATLQNAPLYFVVVLGGTDRNTGDEVLFYCLKGHNLRTVVAGEVVHCRDVWAKGSKLDWQRDIAPNRQFWGTSSKKAGEKTWKSMPDPAMLRRLQSVDLDGRFHLLGWGEHQIDGSAFALEDAEVLIRGLITKDRVLEGGQVIGVTFAPDELDLDAPFLKPKFGGFGEGQLGATSGAADDAQGLWLETVPTASFDLDGSAPGFPGWTFEMIFVADDISTAQISGDGWLAVSGPSPALVQCSWGIIMGPLGVLTFVSKAERHETTFFLPRDGFVSVHATIATDGVTVKVYAKLGREDVTVPLVGDFTLAAPVSPASIDPQLFLGSPFIGPGFVSAGGPWGWILAEARAHDRALTQEEITLRRRRSWAATEEERPRDLWRFAGPLGGSVNEEGGVGLDAMSEILVPEHRNVGDGLLPEEEQGVIGQTIPLAIGVPRNTPVVRSGYRFDDFVVSLILFQELRVRSKQIPLSVKGTFEGLVDQDPALDQLTISDVVGQEGLTFANFLAPDGDLPGDTIDIQGTPPDPTGVHTITFMSEDFRTITIDPTFGGPPVIENFMTIVVDSPAVLVDEPLGLITLNRAQIAEMGEITATAIGLGGGPTELLTQAGLFEAALEHRFGFTGTIEEALSFLNLDPCGAFLDMGSAVTSRQTLDTLISPGWWEWRPDDESFRLGSHGLPVAPTIEISEFDHKGLKTILSQRDHLNIQVQFAKNHKVQSPDAAGGGVPEATRDRFKADGQIVTRDNPDPSLQAINMTDPITIPAVLMEAADIAADSMADLLFTERQWVEFTCASFRTFGHPIGDTARVFISDPTRFWQAGQDIVMTKSVYSTDLTIKREGYGLRQSETYAIDGEVFTVNGEPLHFGVA